MPASAMLLFVLEHLQEILSQEKVVACFVGGCVRDLFLGRPLYDLDIVVDGDAIATARTVARTLRAAFVLLHQDHHIARVVLRGRDREMGITLDFARLRGPDLQADLAARDFTINAMALRPMAFLDAVREETTPAEVIDPWRGQDDLEAGRLRAVRPEAFHDDPLRTLRAVRLAAEMNLIIEPETVTWIRQAAGLLGNVAWERIRDEIARLLACPHAAPYLPLLDDLGLLRQVLPELEATRAAGGPEHAWETICCLEWLGANLGDEEPVADKGRFWRPAAVGTHPHLSARLPFAATLRSYLHEHLSAERNRLTLLKLAALLQQAGDPEEVTATARQAAQRLRLSGKEGSTLSMTVRMLADRDRVLAGLSGREIYRLYRDTGDMATGILLLALADYLATAGPALQLGAWRQRLNQIAAVVALRYEHPAKVISPPRLLDGNDLMVALGLEPGPLIGDLLEEIREAQVIGQVHTLEEALDWARQALDEWQKNE